MGRKKRKQPTHVEDNIVLMKAPESVISSSTSCHEPNLESKTSSNVDNGNVYNHIIEFGFNNKQESDTLSPPSNWLASIYSLSRRRKESITSSTGNGPAEGDERERETTSSNTNSKVSAHSQPSSLVKEEIEKLTDELNAVKHTLWPAAMHTSRVKNKSNHKKRKRKQGQEEQQQQKTYNYTTPSLEFRYAREQSNPFETLGTHKWLEGKTKSFVCRSAMKLANIDAMLDFSLTSCSEKLCPTFKFVDLCGAPGGFSEYILRRKNECNCIGYGMSLQGTNDDGNGLRWNTNVLSNLTKAPAVQKNTIYKQWKMCNGQDGTGDIYNWDNVLKLQNMIQSSSDNADGDEWKVNLVVADGGFDAQRDSENQESLAHALVTSQTAASLLLLKRGGHFVIKMFGFQQSLQLIQHLYNSFEELVFVKPITSRPASAERYLVCLNYKGLDQAFDVLTWRDDIINHDEEGMVSKMADKHIIEPVLDQMDRDMLRLNIQACSGIISILWKEEERLHSNTELDNDDDGAIDFSYYRESFKINF